MKPSELQEKTCHQFDCAIKTVIRHRAIDFYRAIRRSEKKEMPFAEIMDDLLNSIGKTCHQFDCAIKTVIRHRAIDFYRAIRRSEKKEMPFAEIMDDLLNSIGTEDTYSTDYVAVFEVCGEKVSIEDEQLARALKAIEERKRNIVLQYFFIGDTDTYIGKMLDCSRANVTKCRIQALDKLKQLIEEEKEKCQKS